MSKSKIIAELNEIVDLLPTSMGMLQNNTVDNKVNIYTINGLVELMNKIMKLNKKEQDYILYRWFIYQTSKLDEEMFGVCDNVTPNPNVYSKDYDFKIDNIPFDLKSTKMSEQYRVNYDRILKNPTALITHFYEEQSRERRFGLQNRLFLVYVSDKTPNNINHLRLNYDIKSQAIAEYCILFNSNDLFTYNEKYKSDIIFIKEDEDGLITYKIASR